MSSISAGLVKELRHRTGLGMMDCKNALVGSAGDIEQAIESLRKSSGLKAAKKAGRVASEGLISVKSDGADPDQLMEVALEAGAEDVVESEDSIDVVAAPAEFAGVRDAIAASAFEVIHAEISMEPSTSVSLSGKEAEQMLKLNDALEDLDDVQQVYANVEISDDEIAELAG